MKFIVNVLILLLAAYGAYTLNEEYAPAEWPHWKTAEVQVPPPMPAEPEALVQHIICPTCEGEGRLTYADRRGVNHAYSCPICNGLGYRDLSVPPDQRICPDCKGMGLTEKRETRHAIAGEGRGLSQKDRRERWESSKDDAGYIVRASRCHRCNLTGVIGTGRTPPATKVTPGVQTPAPAR